MNKFLIIILFVLFNSQLAFSETKVPYKIVDPRNIGTPEEQKKLADREFQICLEYVEYSTYYKFEPYLTKEKECGFHRDLLVNSEKDFQFYWEEYFYTSYDPIINQFECIYGDCKNGDGVLIANFDTTSMHVKGEFKDKKLISGSIFNFEYGLLIEIKKTQKPIDFYSYINARFNGKRLQYNIKENKVYHYYNLIDEELLLEQIGEFKDNIIRKGTEKNFSQNFVYTGEFNASGFYHGLGKLESMIGSSNFVMEGTFHNGLLIKGHFELYEDNNKTTRVEGTFKNNDIHGEAVTTITFPKNGDNIKTIMTANYDNGKIKKGSVKVTGHSNPKLNYLYEGEIESFSIGSFIFNGKGKIKWDSGSTYIGEFINNKREGLGTYKFQNGDIYTGEFKNNKRDGIGKMVYANGEVYEGKWTNNKPAINLKTDKKYYALVIGNNDYQHLEKLDAAVNDAKVIAEILDEKYDFEVELLLNANYETTVDKFYTLSRKLTKDDNFLVFYAGHGYLDKKQNRGYWLPVDAKSDLPSKWISNALIADELKATEAKHVLLIVDSCFSGSLMRSSEKISENKNLNKKYIDLLKSKKTRLVISSGGNEPVVDSDGGDHSIFAVKLIDTLKNNDSVLTTQDIFENIRKYVASNAEQTPERAAIYKAGHDGGDFLFFPLN